MSAQANNKKEIALSHQSLRLIGPQLPLLLVHLFNLLCLKLCIVLQKLLIDCCNRVHSFFSCRDLLSGPFSSFEMVSPPALVQVLVSAATLVLFPFPGLGMLEESVSLFPPPCYRAGRLGILFLGSALIFWPLSCRFLLGASP